MRRRLAVLLVLALVGVGAFAAMSRIAGEDSAPTPTVTAPPPLARPTIIFPEGFTIREMADRVAAVRVIAIRKRGVTPRLTREDYVRAVDRAVAPPRFRKDVELDSLEGFLFPASYEFTQRTTARELVADQLAAFRQRFRDGRPLLRALEEPDTVRRAHHRVDDREGDRGAARARLVAAVIYNRLRKRMPLGIDATIRYGLDIPGTKSLTKAALRSPSPYNTRIHTGLPPTPIANPGLASIRAAANPARVDYLYYVRKPKTLSHYFTANETDFLRKVCQYGYACD